MGLRMPGPHERNPPSDCWGETPERSLAWGTASPGTATSSCWSWASRPATDHRWSSRGPDQTVEAAVKSIGKLYGLPTSFTCFKYTGSHAG